MEDESPVTYDFPRLKARTQRATEISDEQEAYGNKKFVGKLIETSVEEIQQCNNRSTCPLTWTRYIIIRLAQLFNHYVDILVITMFFFGSAL